MNTAEVAKKHQELRDKAIAKKLKESIMYLENNYKDALKEREKSVSIIEKILNKFNTHIRFPDEYYEH